MHAGGCRFKSDWLHQFSRMIESIREEKKMARVKRTFEPGQLVRIVGAGTTRFRIPRRYHGRTGTVLGTTKIGNSRVLEVDFYPRRANPLQVPVSSVE